jgi:hypothetical protein
LAPAETTAVLVIRAWLEAGSVPPLRARITRTVDVSASVATETVAASEAEILAVVEEWLHSVTRE